MSYEFPNSHIYDNTKICKNLYYMEKDNFQYTEKNINDSFNYYEDNEKGNDNDSYSYKFYQNENHLGDNPDKNQDENPDMLFYQSSECVPLLSDKNIQEKNTKSGKTSATSKVLGRKRARPDKQEKKILTKLLAVEDITKTNYGRKKKNSNEKGTHNQLSEDNVMRKIKSNYLKYSHKRINESFNDKNLQFLKLDSEINENLKKEYNEKLMVTKYKELYQTSLISSKYRKQKDINCNLNKNIIEKIYSEENEEKKENKVIKLMESTYLEVFEDFRTLHLKTFLDEIKMVLIRNNENEDYIQKYLEKMENLCMNYENWFHKKNGRNRKKKIKMI